MRRVSILFVLLALSLAVRPAAAQETDFAWLSIAPEIGYGYFFEGELEVTHNTQDSVKLAARNAFVVKAHIDIGGDGLGLEIAPLWAYEGGGAMFGDFQAFGGELNLMYRFGTGNWYPGIGVGFHGAYIFQNAHIDSGAQLFARVPIGFTWYFLEYLGLVFDAGVMWGGTGIKTKRPATATSTRDSLRRALSRDMTFATGFAFDIMIGLRFP
jgi:hypothetical protein